MSKADSPQTEIGERLRWAREQAGLSQGQVARFLGMHRPTISQIEAGQRALRADEVGQFAELYDVRKAWIITGESLLSDENDPRVELVARELRKLKKDDLDSILRVLKVLRSRGE